MNSTTKARAARCLAAAAAVLLGGQAASGALAVAPIFRSNMVLQRDAVVPVFGSAAAGAGVTVQFLGQSVAATADSSGRWRANLAAMAANTSLAEMTVSSGPERVTFTGVQVGEVWVCSGQSNMGKPLSYANGGAAAIAEAFRHNLRLFQMTAGSGPAASAWRVSDSTAAAGFSAVCYWMGLELSQKFAGVPVGLIQATHDGTAISTWTHTNGGSGEDYVAMVKAIQPFAVKGVSWYQGESDAGDNSYDVKLAGLIGGWRADWGQAKLPFGIVQLTWRPSGWVAAREGQLRASQSVADAFLVVTTDLPVSNYLHPNEKKPVGLRLAIGARGAVYGEAMEFSGPVRDAVTSSVAGSMVTLRFRHTGSGLATSNGKAPGPFKIAGANGRFQSATAVIVGDTVQVSSSAVAAPKMVRYQWDYAVGNLVNAVNIAVEGGAGFVTRLPASQFELKLP